MKRMGWAAGSCAVIALLLTACGSDGGSALSEDDFVDELDSICSDADRDINRLDPSDRNFIDDVLDIQNTGLEELNEIEPPSDLEDDFNDFVANLEDQIAATEDLNDAIDDEDEDAIADAQDELSDLAADADDLADSLGADDCIGIGGASAETTETTGGTTANTPLPINTTESTTVASSAPPITNPPATTASPTTQPTNTQPATTAASVPVMTAPSGPGEGLAEDASTVWNPPAGFQWTPFDLSDVTTPYDDPIVGPALTGYWVGRIENPSTGELALVFISEVGSPFTQEQLDAMITFEVGSNPTQGTTPLGLPLFANFGAGDSQQFDLALTALDVNTLTVLTPAGADVAGLIDAIFTANSMGG